MKQYDMIIIGTGAGNIVLEAAQAKGLKCAQIEHGKFGGTCLNRGCIPTKVMVTAADRVYEVKDAEKIGVPVSNFSIDWETVSKRVWHKINDNIALRDMYLQDKLVDVYEGTGYFLNNHTVAVRYADGRESEPMTAPKIFIATGGKTNVPPIKGLEQVPYETTESFFGDHWPDKPYRRVIVVGGGAIGCEFAHVFRAFGAEVHLVQRNVRLLPKEDTELSAAILNNLRQDGIQVHLNTLTPAVREKDGIISLDLENRDTGEITTIESDVLFICPGIRTTSDNLQLDNTDIAIDNHGWILTNEFLETSVPGVYALGDINGRQQLRHKANYEADILAYNHFVAEKPEDWRWVRYDLVPAVTYTHPEVAHVGLSEEDAKKAGHAVKIGYNRYADTAKGFGLGYDEDSQHQAFAKLIIDENTDEILGMHAIGPFASTLIQPFLNLMNAGDVKFNIINENIASPEVENLRKNPPKRYLDPHKESTVRQTMVPHPSLSEVGIWTYYDLENQKPE